MPSAGCGKTRTLQDGNRTITSGGMSRTYYLKTPSDYDNQHPYRVIFMFHWNYGSINSIVNPPDADHNTDRPFYGIADLSGDTHDLRRTPGAHRHGRGGMGQPEQPRRELHGRHARGGLGRPVHRTSRVFTTGFSYGGAMSYKLACVRPDKFRAALVYEAGPVSGNNQAECTKPIAWFQSHGADDQTFNLQTGTSILNVFTKVNGCTTMTPPTPATNGHNCVSFAGCSAGHPTRWCTFGAGENNPHNTSLRGHYPSPKDPGQSTSWVPMEAWSFITQF